MNVPLVSEGSETLTKQSSTGAAAEPSNQKPLPVRPGDPHSFEPSGSLVIGNRASMQDPADDNTAGASVPSKSGGSMRKRSTAVFRSVFKRSSTPDPSSLGSSTHPSPAFSRSADRDTGRGSTPSAVEKSSKSRSPDRVENHQNTAAPEEIRFFFSIDPVVACRGPLDNVLMRVHRLGKILTQVWYQPENGMKQFDAEIREFEGSLLPLFRKIVSQRRSLDPEESSLEDASDPLDLRRMFAKTPVGIKEQKDTLDLALHAMHGWGKELQEVWKNPDRGMRGFDVKQKAFENSIRPRLDSALYQLQEVAYIQTPLIRIKTACFDMIDKVLTEKVYLDFAQDITSPPNRRVLQQRVPEAEQIFKEMDHLGNPGSSSKMASIKLKLFGLENEEGEDKIGTDYALLVCAYQLCEKYRAAVEEICRELNTPALSTGEPSSIGVVNDLVTLMNRHLDSPWGTLNRVPKEVMKEWLQLVRGQIEFRYLPVFVRGMRDDYRRLLVQNMAVRPSTLRSFDQISKKLSALLVDGRMSAPIDFARGLKLANSVHCYVDGQEVKETSDTPMGRFKMYLRTFGHLFGEPEMFIFLAKKMGYPTEDKQDLLSDYPGAYAKFLEMSEDRKAGVKRSFEKQFSPARFTECYGPLYFEKVLKYFKVLQNILGQQTLYLFTHNLLDIRREKFGLRRIGTKKLPEDSTIRKNEYTISVAGSRCDVKVIRYDSLLDVDVILKQEYSFGFDVVEDQIFPPPQDNVFICIECPKQKAEDNPDIKTALFDLPLVMESLGFQPLKIKYK